MDVDASVGVALAPEHGEDLPTLLRCADVAMYDAKRASAGVAVYDVATDPREARQLNLLGELRQALSNNELRLFYQPKSSSGGQVNQVEALLRWQHPERGLLGRPISCPTRRGLGDSDRRHGRRPRPGRLTSGPNAWTENAGTELCDEFL